MIVTITLNPGIDKTLTVPSLKMDEVLRASQVRLDWGGKGFNVSRCLKTMGMDSLSLGFVGGEAGRLLADGLASSGISTDFIQVAGETRTNTVIMSAADGRYVKVNESGPVIQTRELDALRRQVAQKVRPRDTWVFCGSLPQGVPANLYAELIEIIQSKGATAFLDTSGEALELGCKARPFLVKPNREELAELTGQPVETDAELTHAIQSLLEDGIRYVAVSLGADGLLLASRCRSIHVYAPRVTLRNPVGPGDALLAGILWAFANGLPAEYASCWGVAAGTVTVMSDGVNFGPKAEIEKWYGDILRSKPALIPEPPPFLMTSEQGSFARFTIVERKPQIIAQVLQDNPYPPDIVAAVEAFKQEIANGIVRPLSEQAGESMQWASLHAEFEGKTWLELPWYFAETFFYRRLLEATGYYQSGPWQGINPFQKQKDRQTLQDIRLFTGELNSFSGAAEEIIFEALLHSCLWGNRTDLSNTTVKLKGQGGMLAVDERHLILIDHTQAVRSFLEARPPRVDFINDNIGHDLLFDLALADFLLHTGWTQKIVFHLKAAPFFVSDAMPQDVLQTIGLLKESGDPAVMGLGKRLEESAAGGQFELHGSPFWNSGLFYTQLPEDIRYDLAQADLVILKGDVNYRRLLEDRRWPHDTRLEDVTRYFPAPFVSLRTLKGEIMVGLTPDQAETLQVEDPTWMLNGKRGLIHFVPKETTGDRYE